MAEAVSFGQLGLAPELQEACKTMGFDGPTPIQAAAIPAGLQGRDIIGIAQTGSGKTAAYSLPILHRLIENPKRFKIALVLAPTRELADQVADHIQLLGGSIGAKVVSITGGLSMSEQAISLQRKTHIIVGTPGRLQDHFEHTKGFHMNRLEYLVFDEADRILRSEFRDSVDPIIQRLPTENRKTYLFSATMTADVKKLQMASLRDPVKLEIGGGGGQPVTPEKLTQNFIRVPSGKSTYALVWLLRHLESKSEACLVFVSACSMVETLQLQLTQLGIRTLPLSSEMSTEKRKKSIRAFRDGEAKILIATDVAGRGLDIPEVDVVINVDLPLDPQSYIHRVGRTARAGRSGRSISFIGQYDLEVLSKIEAATGVEMELFEAFDEGGYMSLKSEVESALVVAKAHAKSNAKGRKVQHKVRQMAGLDSLKGGNDGGDGIRRGLKRFREDVEGETGSSLKRRKQDRKDSGGGAKGKQGKKKHRW